VRHIPFALLHDRLFMLRNLRRIFAHTFRGSSIKSILGLEDERRAFERYRAIRQVERAYL